MGKSLTEIAQQLKDSNKKVQLIYAFNGTGKTRLSREFRLLVDPKVYETDEEPAEDSGVKIIYYNAFTEDLFYWDNDLEFDANRKLKIQPNAFTNWILKVEGKEKEIISNFQRYTDEKLTPHFNAEYFVKDKDGVDSKVEDFSEVTFSFERGNEEPSPNIKISKGEESNFVWCLFYTFLEQVIEVLDVAEPSDRDTDQFDKLGYVFIDDPVSSLDENHLIQLAVDLAQLIKSSQSKLKFVITTHNPLFYNVLHNEFNSQDKSIGYKPKVFAKYRLEKQEDGTFEKVDQPNDSPFSYHLYLKNEIEKAIEAGKLDKYHFNFLRNILEKTSTFLGYAQWGDLLPKADDDKPNPYEARIINISSHSKYSGEEVAILKEDDKRVLKYLVKELNEMYRFNLNTTK